jgi:PAS domain S-box-containing protein
MTGEPQPRATIGVRKPDGEISWAVFTAVPVKDRNGVTIGALATFLDITERKNLEEARRRSDATLSSVLESAPSLIMTTDRDGTILFVNQPSFAGLFPRVLVGRNLREILLEEGYDQLGDAVSGALSDGTSAGIELQGKGSTPGTFAVFVGPVRRGEQVEGVTLVASDVTAIAKLQSQLVVSERLAALGTLAAGVAHEINNPLTYVTLKLSALVTRAESGQIDSSDADNLRAVAEGADRIARIVRDLGRVTQLAKAETESVNLASVIKVALEMVRVETKDRARVVQNFDENICVAGDEARLVQVLLNLFINAAQAIDEGDAKNNEIRVNVRPEPESRVRIEVEDTGRGIAAGDIERVFEPFFTTKGPTEGTGLGLHVCHQIVTSLGGDLSVQSVRGQGTCFTILLPAAAARAPIVPDLTAPRPSNGNYRILVIDDEHLILRTFEALLQGHVVECAGSGREGIERLRNAEFDVIFCDVSMPDLTGMDVYEFLRTEERGRETGLVFMTGGAFKQSTVDFLQSVPNRVLRKPFPFDAIESCLPS